MQWKPFHIKKMHRKSMTQPAATRKNPAQESQRITKNSNESNSRNRLKNPHRCWRIHRNPKTILERGRGSTKILLNPGKFLKTIKRIRQNLCKGQRISKYPFPRAWKSIGIYRNPSKWRWDDSKVEQNPPKIPSSLKESHWIHPVPRLGVGQWVTCWNFIERLLHVTYNLELASWKWVTDQRSSLQSLKQLQRGRWRLSLSQGWLSNPLKKRQVHS